MEITLLLLHITRNSCLHADTFSGAAAIEQRMGRHILLWSHHTGNTTKHDNDNNNSNNMHFIHISRNNNDNNEGFSIVICSRLWSCVETNVAE